MWMGLFTYPDQAATRIADIRLTDIGQIYEISLYHVFLKSERHMPVAKIIVFCNNIRYNFSEKNIFDMDPNN